MNAKKKKSKACIWFLTFPRSVSTVIQEQCVIRESRHVAVRGCVVGRVCLKGRAVLVILETHAFSIKILLVKKKCDSRK